MELEEILEMSKKFVRNPKFREQPPMCERCKVNLLKDKSNNEWRCPICTHQISNKEK
jgi:tRNA(Ile2) C34 agmatinyltransferase TiaS